MLRDRPASATRARDGCRTCLRQVAGRYSNPDVQAGRKSGSAMPHRDAGTEHQAAWPTMKSRVQCSMHRNPGGMARQCRLAAQQSCLIVADPDFRAKTGLTAARPLLVQTNVNHPVPLPKRRPARQPGIVAKTTTCTKFVHAKKACDIRQIFILACLYCAPL